MTIVTAEVSDITGRPDNTRWEFLTPVRVREGSVEGSIITNRTRLVQPLDGSIRVELDPGPATIKYDGNEWEVTIPEEDSSLWDIISAAVAVPPDTALAMIGSAVSAWLQENPPSGDIEVDNISDAGTVGAEVVKATTQAAARTAIGAGTSNLTIGTTGSTAKAGNWAPAVADLSDASAWVEDALTGTPAEARDAIEAVTLAESLAEAQARIAAWAGADAYIDFTNKADGDPPSTLDTGQAVDFVYGSSNWKPQIASGKLVAGALPVSGTYADYYQAQLDGACRAFGSRWTVNSADGSTQGVVCIAAWAGIYQTTGTIVPRHAAHVTFSTTTGAWQYWVSDGLDSAHFVMVKSGTFTAPASNGSAIWECAVYVDPDNGIAHVYLPGNDSVTGNRFVSVTNAEIATAQTAASAPVRTLAYLVDGTSVVMVEHFASATPSTAIMPRFLNMWGQVLRPTRDAAALMRQRAIAPKTKSYKIHAPTTQLSVATTASTAIVDASNVFIEQYAGPTGVVLIDVSAWYEFTTGDTLFWRLRDTITAATTPSLAAWVGTTGQNALVSRVMAFTGLTPGQRIVANLQHWSLVAATATLKAGGSSGHRPPLTLVAESI